MQQHLSDVQAENAQLHIQLNIANFQKENAADALRTCQHTFELLDKDTKSAKDVISKLQSERDRLLEFVNNIRTQTLPQFTAFEHDSEEFIQLSQFFISELLARKPSPCAADNSRLIQLEAQLEELTSANVAYAKESREQRAQIQLQQHQISELRNELGYLRHRHAATRY